MIPAEPKKMMTQGTDTCIFMYEVITISFISLHELQSDVILI